MYRSTVRIPDRSSNAAGRYAVLSVTTTTRSRRSTASEATAARSLTWPSRDPAGRLGLELELHGPLLMRGGAGSAQGRFDPQADCAPLPERVRPFLAEREL